MAQTLEECIACAMGNRAYPNSINQVYDVIKCMLKHCCNDSGGSTPSTDKYVTNIQYVPSTGQYNLIYNTGSPVPFNIKDESIVGYTNKVFEDGDILASVVTLSSNQRVLKNGDLAFSTVDGTIWSYNSSLSKFKPISYRSEISDKLDINGQYVLPASFVGNPKFAQIPTNHKVYYIEVEGQLQRYDRGDFTLSGNLLTIPGASEQRFSIVLF